MSLGHGASVVRNGLLLYLDASNRKSLNIPSQADHGFADWYCFVTATATYSIVNSSGGIIYENNAGTITALVTATGPQRGTITVTAGRTYYGSVPINLVTEGEHQAIAPLTMAGTQFFNAVIRYNPTTYYVYTPYDGATVNFYDNTAGGLTGTPTSTISLGAGQTGTFSSNNLTNHWISSTVPVIVTAVSTALPGDKTILSPMANYVYQRFPSYQGTTNFTTPTLIGTNVISDSTYKVMSVNIADGSGNDCAQGLGLEYLSDTYSFGNAISDYAIAAPYSGTVVTAYYWSGSIWVAWETHSLEGTITSPGYVRRDMSSGPGVDGTIISGGAANSASTLWKWEGNKPFYLCINDGADDEFSVLGWLQSRVNQSPRSGRTWNDLSGNGNNGTLVNGPIFSRTNNGIISLDGVDDYIEVANPQSLNPGTGSFSVNTWIKQNDTGYNGIVEARGTSLHGFLILLNYTTAGRLSFFLNTTTDADQNVYLSSVSAFGAIDTWMNICTVVNRASSPSTIDFYLNGVKQGTTINVTSEGTIAPVSGYRYWVGGDLGGPESNATFGLLQHYNRALTPIEIRQNFEALRGRYGI